MSREERSKNFVKDPNMKVNLNDTSKGILGDSADKLGHYSMSTGGGTPLKKGEKLKDRPDAKRVLQPRDEEGHFTYNSVNGIPLKDGPSRGTTVPPMLRGMKLTFCTKGTVLKLEGENGIKTKIMTIDMSVEEMVNACKYYIEEESGFAGMGEGSSITKKGRKSQEEKEASLGQVGRVNPKKLSKSTQKEMKEAKKFYEKNNSAEKVNPQVGGFKVVTDTLNPDGSVTRNAKERYHEFLRNNGLRNWISIPRPTTSKPTEQIIDQRLANSNPEAYYTQNKDLVDSITDAINNSLEEGAEKFTVENVIDAIARGDINDAIFEGKNVVDKPNAQEEENKAMQYLNVK